SSSVLAGVSDGRRDLRHRSRRGASRWSSLRLVTCEGHYDSSKVSSRARRRVAELADGGATPAVPALARDAGGLAQRRPDLAGTQPGGDGLLGRAAAELVDDELPDECAPVRVPELLGDGELELAPTHSVTLP